MQGNLQIPHRPLELMSSRTKLRMQLQPLVYYFHLNYPTTHIQKNKHVRTYIYTEDRCISKIVWAANGNASRACQKLQVVLRDAADQEPITPLGFTFQSYAGPIQSHCAGFKKPEIKIPN